MTDLIIQGINGRMGHTLVEKISARSDCRIVAGVDQKSRSDRGYPGLRFAGRFAGGKGNRN